MELHGINCGIWLLKLQKNNQREDSEKLLACFDKQSTPILGKKLKNII
jgi:hypothetical protein